MSLPWLRTLEPPATSPWWSLSLPPVCLWKVPFMEGTWGLFAGIVRQWERGLLPLDLRQKELRDVLSLRQPPASGWVPGTTRVQKGLQRLCPLPCMVTPPPQRRTESGCDHRACLLQVAAYGGKLRYSLSYTAGAQGSPLSDPDVQITVSTWVPHQADRRERQRQGTPSVFLSSRSSTQLTRHPPTGRAHAPTPPFGHYPGRGPAGRRWGQWAPT